MLEVPGDQEGCVAVEHSCAVNSPAVRGPGVQRGGVLAL